VRAVSLTDIDAVCDIAAETGRIAPEDKARILRFRDNPSAESWANK
jgi:orotate phosphoribosyltransferase